MLNVNILWPSALVLLKYIMCCEYGYERVNDCSENLVFLIRLAFLMECVRSIEPDFLVPSFTLNKGQMEPAQ